MERLNAMLFLTACHGSGVLVEALIAEGAQVNAQNQGWRDAAHPGGAPRCDLQWPAAPEISRHHQRPAPEGRRPEPERQDWQDSARLQETSIGLMHTDLKLRFSVRVGLVNEIAVPAARSRYKGLGLASRSRQLVHLGEQQSLVSL